MRAAAKLDASGAAAEPNQATAAVELDDVSKEYAGVTALHAASLSIGHGEFVAIVGPSGSGKSTMLQLIGTLDRPSTGIIRVHGHDVAQLDDRSLAALRAQRIGFIFQQFHLSPGMPAVENVAEGMLYQGIPLAERRIRATRALERVGLGHRLGHRPHELSGGNDRHNSPCRRLDFHNLCPSFTRRYPTEFPTFETLK